METKMQTLMSKGERTLVFPWRQIKSKLHETQRREGQKYVSPWQTTEIQVQCNNKLHPARSALSHDLYPAVIHAWGTQGKNCSLKACDENWNPPGAPLEQVRVVWNMEELLSPRVRGQVPDLSLPWCFAAWMWLRCSSCGHRGHHWGTPRGWRSPVPCSASSIQCSYMYLYIAPLLPWDSV